MPYIITMKQPGTKWLSEDPIIPTRQDTPIASRVTIATLEEAQGLAYDIVQGARPEGDGYDDGPWPDLSVAAEHLPEAGDTIGPLPDGTVIKVEPA